MKIVIKNTNVIHEGSAYTRVEYYNEGVEWYNGHNKTGVETCSKVTSYEDIRLENMYQAELKDFSHEK